MITKYIKGDVTKTELKYLAHGCNCSNAMVSGVARAIYEAFPEVKEKYHAYASQYEYSNYAKKQLLGEIQSVKSRDKIIYNLFTQLNYGYDGKRYVDYVALLKCFISLTEALEGQIIAIPKIGSGLAGGSWIFIEQMINDATQDKLEIWVYEF